MFHKNRKVGVFIGTALLASAAQASLPPVQGAPNSRPIEVHEHAIPSQHEAELPPPVMTPTRIRQDFMMMAAKEIAADCDPQDLASLSGSALTQAIQKSDMGCINDLFQARGNVARNLFQESKMVTVAQAIASESSRYQGDNTTGMEQLILYMRAGYFVQWYHSDEVGDYSNNLKQQAATAITAFMNSALNYLHKRENASVMGEALTLVDSSLNQGVFVYDTIYWLQLLQDKAATEDAYARALNSIFTIYFRGHGYDDFKQKVANDSRVAKALYDFIMKNDAWLNDDRSYLVLNATRELGRFLQYDGTRKAVGGWIGGLMDKYPLASDTVNMWALLAGAVELNDPENCSEYDACNVKQRVKEVVLTIRHDCSPTITVNAQAMSTKELASACETLGMRENIFHDMLNTGKQPVADDFNDKLELVVFKNSGAYGDFGWLLFGIDTNNGGMYLEGTPSDPNNQARFIAYQADYAPGEHQVWNLEHEYVHYLDGRFDLYGDFNTGMQVPTVWWTEGLAEYVSKLKDNPGAEDVARREKVALSKILRNTYDDGVDRIYRWGYWSARYMLEQRPSDTTQILSWFRAGDYESFEAWLNSTGQRYDEHFANWLAAVLEGNDDGGDDGDDDGDDGGDDGDDDGGDDGGDDGSDDPRALEPGKPKSLTAGAGSQAYYFMFAPHGTDLLHLLTRGDNGDVSVYVKHDGWPTTTDYDQKSTSGNADNSIQVSSPEGGTYYHVLLTSTAGYSDLCVTVGLNDAPTDCGDTGGGDDGGDSSEGPELLSGKPRSNLESTHGEYYWFFVPAGTRAFELNTWGGRGDVDLYVRNAGWPDASTYDDLSARRSNNERIVVRNPNVGTYYHVWLKTDGGYSGVNLQLTLR
ncbi:collagenase family protein [Hahella chejuensis KCTC 2396]|uniref:microbial collagenase n=1 Tax=Hahella chejuensis (strain KCTC 2396) TaxID=349521 RepID=Q2SA85_HAHCH|nr:M9 family metallopeptidase [Hahella chejuensis]ABC32439.1 collagenase family protein [Hahella chejuensis KCTC 2396]